MTAGCRPDRDAPAEDGPSARGDAGPGELGSTAYEAEHGPVFLWNGPPITWVDRAHGRWLPLDDGPEPPDRRAP
ncbi:hypothetical protein EES43_07225 [Streptomyces sp. ADI96-02]|uniref:hypothetical protein n=1 Tax=unclassified Streptomyces TaxID=2593676 RepID=UPI000F54F192|nr:hypothetical protein [Streptomyces sp. ADI96-02]RPK65855.1 hypothetical protein EES43_07225 [Streptomyces sp. ADI96-02]